MNSQNRYNWIQARKSALELEWNMQVASYTVRENEVLFELRRRIDGAASYDTSYATGTIQARLLAPLPQAHAGPSALRVDRTFLNEAASSRPTAATRQTGLPGYAIPSSELEASEGRPADRMVCAHTRKTTAYF